MPKIQASPALARLRILDLTRVRAGPTCVRQFADFGADECGGRAVGGGLSVRLRRKLTTRAGQNAETLLALQQCGDENVLALPDRRGDADTADDQVVGIIAFEIRPWHG